MSNQNHKSNGNGSKKTAPVAILIILGIVLFVGGILYLREYKIGQSFAEYKVDFKTVGTLALGDPVRVSGVKIGKVTSIDLKNKYVSVNLHVDNKYKIPKDSKFYIKSMGIMGERMVTILLGESEEYIVDGQEYSGKYESGIGDIIGEVGVLLVKTDTMLTYIKSIVDSTAGKENFANNFSKIVNEIGVVTSDLSELVHNNKGPLNRSIGNFEKLSTNGNKLVLKADKFVDNISTKIDTISDGSKTIIENLKEVTAKTKSIVSKVDSGNGLASKIINDEKMAADVKKLTKDIDTTVKKIDKKGIKIRFFGD